MAIGDEGRGKDLARLIEKACHLPSPREPRCLVHPEGDSTIAVAGKGIYCITEEIMKKLFYATK